ncbi:hypothetical protein [Micromonospora pisi]|nr:hypothetical protein [Micromonospora pisi]
MAQGHRNAVAAEHRLIHAVVRLTGASVHADLDHPAGDDPHEVLSHHR